MTVPLHFYTLSLFPYVFGELQLEGSFEDETEEISGFGETFLPLQLVGDGVAAEEVLCDCSQQAFLYGNPMHLTDKVIGKKAFQVVSKCEVTSQSSHEGD